MNTNKRECTQKEKLSLVLGSKYLCDLALKYFRCKMHKSPHNQALHYII